VEVVARFLTRLAGWEEGRGAAEERFAVIEQPRGRLLASGGVELTPQGARYV
jgi:hypothetical protein